MSAYGWCPVHASVEIVERTVTRPRWIEKPPHYDFTLIDIDIGACGHALKSLCEFCGKHPARDGVDACILCWPVDCDEPINEFKRDNILPVADLTRRTA